MDDLDHSMRIAEEDWSNFYQESEECRVPRPLLACPKGLRCPDRSVSATQSLQILDGNITACVKVELIQGVVGTREEVTAEDKAQICNATGIPLLRKEVQVTEEFIPEETKKIITQTPEAVVNDVARSLSTERDTNVRLQAEDGLKVPPREEKERWFVTLSLNDRPGPRRACATPRKKKTKLIKNSCRPKWEPQHDEREVNKNINAIPNQNRSKEQVGQNCKKTRRDCGIEEKQRKRPRHGEDIKQNSEEGTMHDEDLINLNTGDLMKTRRDGEMMHHNSREATLHGDDTVLSYREGILHNYREGTLHERDNMWQDKIDQTLTGDDKTQNNSEGTSYEDHTTHDHVDETRSGDDGVQNNREGTLHEDCTMQNHAEENPHIGNITEDDKEGTQHEIFHLERVDSDEFEDSVESFTLHSSGSEIYLSASESVAQDLVQVDSVGNQPIKCPSYSSSSLSHSCDQFQSTGAVSLQARESDGNCEGSGNQAFVKPTFAFPLTGQRGATPPVVSSIQQNEDLPRVQIEPHLTCPRSVPDVIVTPVADGPEAYAQAAGRTPCVYAISAFWDEMEKLTINDILQLRMAKSPPPTEMSDVPSQNGSQVDAEEHHLTDGGLADVSDAADSDYFTQPDESKADRSSWDFSVCDFEDDYCQFLDISRNPSPDLSCKTQQEEEDEEEGTRSQTPLPLEDSARQNPTPRGMTKNKSVQNVQSLNIEDLSLESHLYHVDKSKRDSLGWIVAAPAQEDNLESFITQGTGNRNIICVYDPEGISSAPGCDDNICTCQHQILPTQSHKWKPIPIFSCSRPTVRELTLPKWNYPFLSVDFLEEDVISPIRIVSHALRVAESQRAKTLLPFGKIRLQDKGSIWCRRSDGWELPSQSVVPPQVPEQQRIVGSIPRPVRVGVLSALQQSDMCLLCIAFASWVLTSSDPESADAWKAALLANVSALSAIQYLRQIK